MIIYFDSRTGNVMRFAEKVAALNPNWKFVNVQNGFLGEGYLITYTAGAGEVPHNTRAFLEQHSQSIMSVSVSGNRNWGSRFGAAAAIINLEFNIPTSIVFELSGFGHDVQAFITKIRTNEKATN
ncbi:MAG: class Ib ribonucleoside-diphosphate reductase assembly flavoprotein NrdI [Olivibacter sp.]|nr:class Ib ribonucleoside-diphosphate reductase assembly flavoprotein NrdI [Olivibacter sp. UJ_SKK_5.1]